MREDLERILFQRGVAWSLMQGDAKEGARYGRFGVRAHDDQPRAAVRNLRGYRKLGYVKTAL